MTDIWDRAQDADEKSREYALSEHARRARRGLAATSATHCQAPHCGEPIPEPRRQAIPGVQLCVECAALAERGAEL